MKKLRLLLLRSIGYLLVLGWLLIDFRTQGPLHRLIHDSPSSSQTPFDPLDAPVATVNTFPITERMLNRAVQTRLWRQGKTTAHLTPNQLFAEKIIALDDLIIQKTAELGMIGPAGIPPPSDEEINREINRIKGIFSSQKNFDAAVTSQGENPTAFRNRIASQLRAEKWLNHKTNAAIFVSDPEIATWFHDNNSSLTVPQQFHARHIFLTTHNPDKPHRKAEIDAIAEKLRLDPTSFNQHAANSSEDARTRHSGGDLGWFTADEAPPEITEALQKLPPNGTTPPTLTPLGYHILQLIAIKPARPATLAESADRIRRFLRNRKRIQASQTLRQELKTLTKIKYIPTYDPARFK